jgi:hypothetical protein
MFSSNCVVDVLGGRFVVSRQQKRMYMQAVFVAFEGRGWSWLNIGHLVDWQLVCSTER